MARLPVPGSDTGTWGQVLNDFLGVAHDSNGALKTSSISAGHLQDNIITEAKLDSTVRAKLNVGAGGSVADATASSKGIVQLAGDLAGTAAAPTVPGLANKANTAHSHVVADVSGLQTTLDSKAATSHSHSLDSLTDVSTSGATNGQSLVYQSGSWSPATVSSGSGGVTDHGALTGLSDDDHPQYLNNVRGLQVVVAASAGAARPVGATSVLWICNTEPTNMTNNDLWLGPDAA